WVPDRTLSPSTAFPFEEAFGGWEAALAIWALPALVAAAVWVPLAVRAHDPVPAPVGQHPVRAPPAGRPHDPVPAPVGHPLWRNSTAWSIALFMGLQSMAFFSTITWLPDILVDDGFSAGEAGTLAGVPQVAHRG